MCVCLCVRERATHTPLFRHPQQPSNHNKTSCAVVLLRGRGLEGKREISHTFKISRKLLSACFNKNKNFTLKSFCTCDRNFVPPKFGVRSIVRISPIVWWKEQSWMAPLKSASVLIPSVCLTLPCQSWHPEHEWVNHDYFPLRDGNFSFQQSARQMILCYLRHHFWVPWSFFGS